MAEVSIFGIIVTFAIITLFVIIYDYLKKKKENGKKEEN